MACHKKVLVFKEKSQRNHHKKHGTGEVLDMNFIAYSLEFGCIQLYYTVKTMEIIGMFLAGHFISKRNVMGTKLYDKESRKVEFQFTNF